MLLFFEIDLWKGKHETPKPVASCRANISKHGVNYLSSAPDLFCRTRRRRKNRSLPVFPKAVVALSQKLRPILPKAVADFDTSSVRFSWRGRSIFSRTVFFGNGDRFPGLHARVSLEVLPSFKNKCNPIFPVKIFSQELSDFPEVHAVFS